MHTETGRLQLIFIYVGGIESLSLCLRAFLRHIFAADLLSLLFLSLKSAFEFFFFLPQLIIFARTFEHEIRASNWCGSISGWLHHTISQLCSQVAAALSWAESRFPPPWLQRNNVCHLFVGHLGHLPLLVHLIIGHLMEVFWHLWNYVKCFQGFDQIRVEYHLCLFIIWLCAWAKK